MIVALEKNEWREVKEVKELILIEVVIVVVEVIIVSSININISNRNNINNINNNKPINQYTLIILTHILILLIQNPLYLHLYPLLYPLIYTLTYQPLYPQHPNTPIVAVIVSLFPSKKQKNSSK